MARDARAARLRPAPEPLLTFAEAADYLGCSAAAVRKWHLVRRLSSVKVGRRLTRFRRQDLDAFVTRSSRAVR